MSKKPLDVSACVLRNPLLVKQPAGSRDIKRICLIMNVTSDVMNILSDLADKKLMILVEGKISSLTTILRIVIRLERKVI